MKGISGKSSLCVAGVAAVLATGGTAQAVVINLTSTTDINQTTGLAFDSLGLELDVAGTPPASSNLFPSGAGWEFQGTSPNSNNVVGGSTAGGPSGGYTGNNYLQVLRNNAQTSTNARFNRDIHPATDSFTTTFAFWLRGFTNDSTANEPYSVFTFQPDDGSTPATANQLAGFGFRYDSAGNEQVFQYVPNGAAASTSAISADESPGATWNGGEWNTATFTWNPAAVVGQRAMLSVNGGQAFSVEFSSGAPIDTIRQFKMLNNLNNSTNPAATAVYVDAVPEPGALGAVAVAAAAALLRRRRA